MIYVPELEKYQCYVVQSEGVIRAYERKPITTGTYNYRDYYIDSSYIYRDGTQTFGTYATYPICLSSDVLTDAYYYRNDFDKILLIFILIVFFVFFVLRMFVRVFFRGFKNV